MAVLALTAASMLTPPRGRATVLRDAAATTAEQRWFEGGRELSGGQWQKLALDRAFFRGAAISILDEPSASIDAVAEAEIFARLADVAARVLSNRALEQGACHASSLNIRTITTRP
jgi:energy-coupling factor transporter ATP-binding protein EcfA2